jgi:flagellar basal body L-ring protein FlgH
LIKRFRLFAAIPLFFIFLQGCAGVQKLRLEPGPTVGGLWPEGELLDRGARPEGRGLASSMEERRQPWQDPRERVRELRYSDMPHMPPAVKRRYEDSRRMRAADFFDSKSDEGSLWASTGQTNYFFTNNKIRGVGDILSLEFEDRLIRDVAAEMLKSLDDQELRAELSAAQMRLDQQRAPAGNQPGEGQAQPTGGAGGNATLADINLTESMGVEPGDLMMVEVLERFPNGNYKLRGSKRIPYKGSVRVMSVTGIARAGDVENGEKIVSGKLYEYRLQVYR